MGDTDAVVARSGLLARNKQRRTMNARANSGQHEGSSARANGVGDLGGFFFILDSIFSLLYPGRGKMLDQYQFEMQL